MTSTINDPTIRVVVVDDDDTDRYLINRTLKRFEQIGEVTEFTDAQELADVFETEEFQEIWGARPPSLMLLDINMPLMSGFELVDYIEACQAREKATHGGTVLILMLTSSCHPDDQARAEASSIVQGFFQKPLDDAKLQAMLTEHYPGLVHSSPGE